MPTPTPPQRIPDLKSALKKYKGAKLESQIELGKIYGVTPARFSALINNRFEEFPAVRMKKNAAWYPARAAIKSMIAYCEQGSKEKKARAKRDQNILGQGGGGEADDGPPLTAVELDRLASAQIKIFKLMKETGKVVDAESVRVHARKTMQIITTHHSELGHILDPNGEWSDEAHNKLRAKSREIILNCRAEFEDYLEDDDAQDAD